MTSGSTLSNCGPSLTAWLALGATAAAHPVQDQGAQLACLTADRLPPTTTRQADRSLAGAFSLLPPASSLVLLAELFGQLLRSYPRMSKRPREHPTRPRPFASPSPSASIRALHHCEALLGSETVPGPHRRLDSQTGGPEASPSDP
jgi:hypothetical protein